MTEELLDWRRAFACAHWAVSRPAEAAAVVATALADAPPFRNRDYPLSVVPVFVSVVAAQRLRADLEGYADLLGSVVRAYRDDPEVRNWYGLGDDAERLIRADTRLGDKPWVCRLDGYLDQAGQQLRVLENNADAPAGTLFTARVNEVLERVLAEARVADWKLSDLTYSGARFFAALMTAARHAGCAAPTAVAVLQPSGAANRESVEMVTAFRAAGVDAYLADPRELRIVRGRAHFGECVADLAWNKVNTVAWRGLQNADFTTRWERALRDTDLVHVNPFGARFVAENKLSLALVQDPRFAGHFAQHERALAARLLPWAGRVTPGALADGGERPLVVDLLDRPAEYVLKEPYDIRGDGVTIGYDCSRTQWLAAVERASSHGHLAQQRVRPTSYPVAVAGSTRAEMMPISLDCYLLGGQLAGFGSKASHHAKVNIFQGGQKLAVHVVEEARP